jgi:hypothetical protein
MKIAYALHSVHLRVDGVSVAKSKGDLFPLDDKEWDYMLSVGAIRAPNEAELTLYRMLNPTVEVAAPAPVEPAQIEGLLFDEDEPVPMTRHPKYIRGEKHWVVVDATGAVVSGSVTFDSKDAALDWVEANPVLQSEEDLLG